MLDAFRERSVQWARRRYPVLLVSVTLVAATIAVGLLIANVNTQAILYKAF
jgi:archaellum biogenesis protein FlaJ (TadC family)